MKGKGYFYTIKFVGQNRMKIGITDKNTPFERLKAYTADKKVIFIILTEDVRILEKKVIKTLEKKYKQFQKEYFEGNCDDIMFDIWKVISRHQIEYFISNKKENFFYEHYNDQKKTEKIL